MVRPPGQSTLLLLVFPALFAWLGACTSGASSSDAGIPPYGDVTADVADGDLAPRVDADPDTASREDVHAGADVADAPSMDPDVPTVFGMPVIAPIVLEPPAAGTVWSGHVEAFSPQGQGLQLEMIGGDDRVRFDKGTGRLLVDVSRLREGPLSPWFRARDRAGLESYQRWSLSPDQHFGASFEAEQNVHVRWPVGVRRVAVPHLSGRATGPLRFRARGTVPPGLDVVERSGWILWRPGQSLAGTAQELQWRATDAEGQSVTARWTLEVVDADPLVLPPLQIDPASEEPIDLMGEDLPDGLRAGSFRCEALRWQGANPGFRFDETSCALKPGELPYTIWQGGSVSWMVVDVDGRKWLAERSVLLTPATECVHGSSVLEDWLAGLAVEAGTREEATLQFCNHAPGTLLEIPFEVPAGAGWFEVSVDHDDPASVDLDLHLLCDNGVLVRSGGSGANDWLAHRMMDRANCRFWITSAWPIVSLVELQITLNWKREPSCQPGQEADGVVTTGQVLTGTVCPHEPLLLPLYQAPPIVELQARDGVLDLEVVSRTEYGEVVLAAALGRPDGALLSLDLSSLPEQAFDEGEERFVRLRPRLSSLRGVDYVLSDPQRGLRQP